MKKIPLTQGKFALVDDADFEAVNQFKWCAYKKRGNRFYAARGVPRRDAEPGKRTSQYLHQFLFPDAKEIDHRDGDGLNNQRNNLRPVTHQQNLQAYQNRRKEGHSIFRGVTISKHFPKWRAQIRFNKKTIFIGYFDSETEAAKAYDTAARKFFGDFASPNFPCVS